MRTRTEIALYLLNHKRAHLRSLEERFRIAIMVNADATIGGQVSFLIEKGEQVHSLEQAKALAMQSPVVVEAEAEEEEVVEYEAEEEQEATEEAPAEGDAFEPEGEIAAAAPAEEQPEAENGQGRGKRRRRRGRRGGERREEGAPVAREASSEHPIVPREDGEEGAAELEAESVEGIAGPSDVAADANGEVERRRRRRGRRGGRRNRRDRDPDAAVANENGHAEEAEPAVAAAEFHAEPVSEPVHHEVPPPLPREHAVERREEAQAEPILAAPPPPPAPAAHRSRRAGARPCASATTKSLGNKVEIRIRDNGTGIPLEVKEKMFNPFFTTKPAGEGTGLGLSMSHDIVVKQHGGKIDVDTEPGAFTEFIITLPRTAAAQTQAGGTN